MMEGVGTENDWDRRVGLLVGLGGGVDMVSY